MNFLTLLIYTGLLGPWMKNGFLAKSFSFTTKEPLCFSQKRLCTPSEYFKVETKLCMARQEKIKKINIPDNLPSVFPSGVPAGLRGEAVRSSLRDPKKGLWCELTNPDTFHTGVLLIQGSGTLSFLHSKFTNSFDEPSLPPFLKNLERSTLKQESHLKGITRETCFLTAKGRTVDTLSVLLTPNVEGEGNIEEYQAHILTSPFHNSGLYEKLDPFVFPMDGIKLVDCGANANTDTDSTNKLSVFCVIGTTLKNAQSIVKKVIIPTLEDKLQTPSSLLPIPNEAEGFIWKLKDLVDSSSSSSSSTNNNNIYIMEGGTMLPVCAARGYTLFVPSTLSSIMKECLIGPLEDNGENVPMEIHPLEWESLRIETGRPSYGREMTADLDKKLNGVKANPLELHLQSSINMEKGCYLGQEGVSSVIKNIRGPPRTLYSVVFDDEENGFDETVNVGDDDDDNHDDECSNLNRQPVVGDELFVLGSNEMIQVGVVTSVAEPGSTGISNTVALALIRRSDSILKKMNDMEIDFGAGNIEDDLFIMVDEKEKKRKMEDRISKPSPVDPLHGLEVIIKGTYIIGKLEVNPRRAIPVGNNFYDIDVVENLDNGSVMGLMDTSKNQEALPIDAQAQAQAQAQSQEENLKLQEDEEELAVAIQEAKKAALEAEAAAAEAKRKAEKMELLKKRAEAAMARRKKKQ